MAATRSSPLAVTHVSTFAPTQCGIASYAGSLVDALRGCRPSVVALDYGSARAVHRDPTPVVPPVVARIPLAQRAAYVEAARQIDAAPVDVVSLQHEFGIFGGPDGAFVLDLLRHLHKPVVTTLHTVSRTLSPARRELLAQALARSARVVVLTEDGAQACRELWPALADRVRVIPHGVPAVPFRRPRDVPLRRHFDADWVFVSSGHTWRHKGYHHALLALSMLADEGVDFRYVILGAGQPQFGGADDYDAGLSRLADKLGIADRIVRVARYVSTRELHEYLATADVGLVTYTRAAHNSSGVMPAMLACGRPVVATRFEYAQDVAARWPDVHLAELADPDDIHRQLRTLIRDRRALAAQQRRAHRLMQPLTWPRAARAYRAVFEEAVNAPGP